MGIKTSTGAPTFTPHADGYKGRACPQCGHTGHHEAWEPWDALMKMLGKRRPAAKCNQPDEDEPTGWSPSLCHCRNTFHGS